MPDRLLEKQRAIITGASSGIGEAIARSFANAGASVVVNYRSSREDAERIVEEIRQRGGGTPSRSRLTYPSRRIAENCLKRHKRSLAAST